MRRLALSFLVFSTAFGAVPSPNGYPTPTPKIPIIKAMDLAKEALERISQKNKKYSPTDMIPFSIRYASQEEVAISFPTQWNNIKQNIKDDDWLWIVSFASIKNRLFVRSYLVDQTGRALALDYWGLEGQFIPFNDYHGSN